MTHSPEAERSHRMARLIRHEVGDLLQSVYSTVAVLLERLPADLALERRLLGDLKNRAETCRCELDAVVDLASITEPAIERTDLAGAFSHALGQARKRYPALSLAVQPLPTVAVVADGRALPAALFLLLTAFCQSTRQQMRIGFTQGERHVDCSIERDGYPVSPEQFQWLQVPFATTQHAVFGLGLALARRAVGGEEVEAHNSPDGGVVVRIRFPVWSDD
jgi:signal transduction histidine kinase